MTIQEEIYKELGDMTVGFESRDDEEYNMSFHNLDFRDELTDKIVDLIQKRLLKALPSPRIVKYDEDVAYNDLLLKVVVILKSELSTKE